VNPNYTIENASDIITPALVLFREAMQRNIETMIRIAGDPARLRPHCKTTKMKEVVHELLDRGISKHKAATFAEAEMLADAGASDICLAYAMVGPNVQRAVKFVKTFPQVTFCVTADHSRPVEALSNAMTDAGQSVGVMLDVDTGLHRSGLEVGPAARELYTQITRASGLEPGGFHVYDGHQHQRDFDQRRQAVGEQWRRVIAFRDELVVAGMAVPRLLAGGTGSFPVYAQMEEVTLELSPGTCIVNDQGYTDRFPDLDFPPAAIVLTRVVSRPAADLVTVDVGTKAVASDPPFGKRVKFPDLPDAEHIVHNEEHLVLRTSDAEKYEPGDELVAIPTHICPTTALHKQVHVVEGQRVTQTWQVVARDRQLNI